MFIEPKPTFPPSQHQEFPHQRSCSTLTLENKGRGNWIDVWFVRTRMVAIMSMPSTKPACWSLLSWCFPLAPIPRKSAKSLSSVHPRYVLYSWYYSCYICLLISLLLIHYIFLASSLTNCTLDGRGGSFPHHNSARMSRAKPISAVYRTRSLNCVTISPYVHCEKHETPPPPTVFFKKIS